MKCPRCQAENLDERVYCWKCFAPLRSGAMGALPTVAPTAATTVPSRGRATEAATRKPPIALLALIGVIVLAVIAVVAFLLLRQPSTTTQEAATTPTTPTASPTTPTPSPAPPSPAPTTPQPSMPPR